MKFFSLIIFLTFFVTNVIAQSNSVLDSLRYYPLQTSKTNFFENTDYVIDHQTENIFLSDKWYLGIDLYISQAGATDAGWGGTYYDRLDSLTGNVYRHIKTFEFQLGSSAVIGPYLFGGVHHLSISSIYADSTEFIIDKLHFDKKPEIGDTLFTGSARFSGGLYRDSLSQVKASDISVLFQGYSEKTDRELEFDNPADTTIRMLHFEIRYKNTLDSLLSYTLAKDIGLIEAKYLYFWENNRTNLQTMLYRFGEITVGDRTFTRTKYNVSVEQAEQIPSQIQILAYPNPFNPTTSIRYSIPNSGSVSIKIYDALGRFVQNLVESYQSSGSHSVNFDATNLASGLYLVRIQFNDEVKTGKIVLTQLENPSLSPPLKIKFFALFFAFFTELIYVTTCYY